MSKILVPTNGPEDWRKLLADPEKHWKRGYSAMAVAQSWENAQGLPTEIANILGRDTELLLAIPEHKVPLPGGQRESQCDVFALVRIGDRICSVAVEAKVRESFAETIGQWMKTPSAGRTTRLKAICEVLGAAYPPPPNLRYQLFHRTAAAIFEATRFKTDMAAMIVHSFSQEHQWIDDFTLFCDFLGAHTEIGKAATVILPDGRDLVLGWATGSPEHL